MPQTSKLSILLFSFLLGTGLASAAPVSVMVSGTFLSTDVPSSLDSPKAPFNISFFINNPVASNAGANGVDVAFSGFTYKLANSPVNVTPQSIRYFNTAGGGGLTVYFGPESGFSGGTPIPEFSFSAAQLFGGTLAAPTFSPGVFPVSEFTYSDAANYDDQLTPGTSVTIAPAPEPATLFLPIAGFGLLALAKFRRISSRTSSAQ